MIPFGDLRRINSKIKEEVEAAVNRVLNSGWFILGKELENFEREFAQYCDKNFGVGVGNGTDAIFLTLKALGIGEGDEVITVANTAIPTISAIVATGAKPVLVDCGEDYLIDVNQIKKKITGKTKAIIPVHLYGQVCDMDKILEIGRGKGITIVEDCAQAHGAEHKGERVPLGPIGCFSFYPSKNLGAMGDAGMIITSDKKLAEKLRLIRNYGQEKIYSSIEKGYNSRLDEIQAAILSAKLKYLDYWNRLRREIAEEYNKKIINKKIIKPKVHSNLNPVFHLYVIRSEEREKLISFLNENRIQTKIHYPVPIHLQEGFEGLGQEGDFPNSEKFSKEVLSLPMFPELLESEVEEICRVTNLFGP